MDEPLVKYRWFQAKEALMIEHLGIAQSILSGVLSTFEDPDELLRS